MAPATQPRDFSSSDCHQLPDPNPDTASGQPWQPKVNRRQSWSQEDQKHQQQERLLDIEQGRETGFTETGLDH
jgi:hypothetical protein